MRVPATMGEQEPAFPRYPEHSGCVVGNPEKLNGWNRNLGPTWVQ
jgi:hypothetical protein